MVITEHVTQCNSLAHWCVFRGSSEFSSSGSWSLWLSTESADDKNTHQTSVPVADRHGAQCPEGGQGRCCLILYPAGRERCYWNKRHCLYFWTRTQHQSCLTVCCSACGRLTHSREMQGLMISYLSGILSGIDSVSFKSLPTEYIQYVQKRPILYKSYIFLSSKSSILHYNILIP